MAATRDLGVVLRTVAPRPPCNRYSSRQHARISEFPGLAYQGSAQASVVDRGEARPLHEGVARDQLLQSSLLSLIAANLALRAIQRNVAPGKTVPVAVHPCVHCHALHLTSDRRSRGKKWSKVAVKSLG